MTGPVLITLALTLVVAGCGSGAPSTSAPGTESAATSPSPVGPPSPTPEPLPSDVPSAVSPVAPSAPEQSSGPSGAAAGAWESVDGDAFGSSVVRDVIFEPAEGRWVAVGCTLAANPDGWDCGTAAAWTSADGRQWEGVELPATTSGGQAIAVTSSGPGFVAVGEVGSADKTSAAFWDSPDGAIWAQSPDVFRNAAATHMTQFGDRLFASGPGVFTEAIGVMLWSSGDGVRWQGGRLDMGTNLAGGLTSTGDRLLIWASTDPFMALPQTVWLSDDSVEWSRVPDQPVFRTAMFRDVRSTDDGLLAVGQVVPETGPQNPADIVPGVWSSTDGAMWTAVGDLEPVPGAGIEELVLTSAGLLAVGTVTRPGTPDYLASPASWIEDPDGGWTYEGTLGSTGGARSAAAAASGDLVVLIASGSGTEPVPVEMWVRPVGR